MAINWLGNHTGKKKHTTEARLADFCLNPFNICRLQKQLFFLPYKCLYFEHYTTVPMVIFRACATCDASNGFIMKLHVLYEKRTDKFHTDDTSSLPRSE